MFDILINPNFAPHIFIWEKLAFQSCKWKINANTFKFSSGVRSWRWRKWLIYKSLWAQLPNFKHKYKQKHKYRYKHKNTYKHKCENKHKYKYKHKELEQLRVNLRAKVLTFFQQSEVIAFDIDIIYMYLFIRFCTPSVWQYITIIGILQMQTKMKYWSNQ